MNRRGYGQCQLKPISVNIQYYAFFDGVCVTVGNLVGEGGIALMRYMEDSHPMYSSLSSIYDVMWCSLFVMY